MNKAAFLSSCGKYRFWLTRVWDESKPLCGWIMLNPSTSDHMEDDATIRRCINFSKGFDFGGMIVVNLFALRSKDKSFIKAHHHPVGPNNDFFIKDQMKKCHTVIAAWGNDGQYHDRDIHVMKMFDELMCLSITARSCPGHPLYLKSDSQLKYFIQPGGTWDELGCTPPENW